MGQKTSPKHSYPDRHGIVLLNKAKGISSNLALQQVRHLFKAKKAGHTGNLDPMATGLLPCCFGDATKLAHWLINADKTYIARCSLGTQTDTGDATGTVTHRHQTTKLNDQTINQACQALSGEIQQTPPMYSALHHQGQRLYQLARQGINVPIPPRTVTIHSFKCLQNQPDFIEFKIKVSKGTYIRTLLEDFAKHCGTVAHMTALHRTQTGIFTADKMHSLEQLKAMSQPQSIIQKMDQALIEYPQITLNADQTQALIHGKILNHQSPTATYRLYDHQQRFLGLGQINNHTLKVKRLFLKSYQQTLKVAK